MNRLIVFLAMIAIIQMAQGQGEEHVRSDAILDLLNASFMQGNIKTNNIAYIDLSKTTLDTAYLHVWYRQTVVQDTIKNGKPKKYEMLLQVGKKTAKYWDFNVFCADTFGAAALKAGEDATQIMSKVTAMRKGSNGDVIFSNMKEDYLTVTLPFTMPLMYEEKIPEINWRLENDTETVFNYECKKATCRLFGRNYTAWYAPEIPISYGPWKFSGLPGLILKITDDREQVSFECYGLEQMQKAEPMYLTERKYVKSEKKEALKLYDDYQRNPMAYMESSGIRVNARTRDGSPANLAKLQQPYNPIELYE